MALAEAISRLQGLQGGTRQLRLPNAKLETAAPESLLCPAGTCLQEAATARQALAEATSELQALQGIAEQRDRLQRGLEAALAERDGLQDRLQSLQQSSEAGLQQVTAERDALQEQLSAVTAEHNLQGPKVSASPSAHSQLLILPIWNHTLRVGSCHKNQPCKCSWALSCQSCSQIRACLASVQRPLCAGSCGPVCG